MADATTAVVTEKKENQGSGVQRAMNTVYTRTFTFPVLASATGYGASDVITVASIPADTQILSLAIKSSVAQSTGSTYTFAITGQSAFSAALAPTTANIFYPSAITEANAASVAAETALTCTIGTNTCDAGTITVTMVCAGLGAGTAGLTTYSI
jgi:hypothetical protein